MRAVLFIVSEVVESITFVSMFSSIHGNVGSAQKRYRIGAMQRIESNADTGSDL